MRGISARFALDTHNLIGCVPIVIGGSHIPLSGHPPDTGRG